MDLAQKLFEGRDGVRKALLAALPAIHEDFNQELQREVRESRGRLRSILIALPLKQCFLCCASSITAEPALQPRGKAFTLLVYWSGMVGESFLTDSRLLRAAQESPGTRW